MRLATMLWLFVRCASPTTTGAGALLAIRVAIRVATGAGAQLALASRVGGMGAPACIVASLSVCRACLHRYICAWLVAGLCDADS